MDKTNTDHRAMNCHIRSKLFPGLCMSLKFVLHALGPRQTCIYNQNT